MQRLTTGRAEADPFMLQLYAAFAAPAARS
jgi:hypothetical protein